MKTTNKKGWLLVLAISIALGTSLTHKFILPLPTFVGASLTGIAALCLLMYFLQRRNP